MEALFDKSNNKKWTIIVEHIDNDNMTAYVQNWGWDENQLIREFKKANTNGFEKDISENELKTLLQTVIVNYNIIGVYEITNRHNTDMKTINKIKTNREEFLCGKGYTIVNHCEVKIEYSKDSEQIYTTRGLLKLYSDQYKSLQNKITTLEEDCEELEEDCKEIDDIHNIKTKQLAELNTIYINVENDLNKLIERYRNGVKELKKIESKIETLKENLPDEVKELMDKKENLLLTINSFESDVNKLTKEEADKKDKIKQIVNKLTSIEDEYYKRQNEYNDLKSKYNDLKNAYDELIETVSSMEGIL